MISSPFLLHYFNTIYYPSHNSSLSISNQWGIFASVLAAIMATLIVRSSHIEQVCWHILRFSVKGCIPRLLPPPIPPQCNYSSMVFTSSSNRFNVTHHYYPLVISLLKHINTPLILAQVRKKKNAREECMSRACVWQHFDIALIIRKLSFYSMTRIVTSLIMLAVSSLFQKRNHCHCPHYCHKLSPPIKMFPLIS